MRGDVLQLIDDGSRRRVGGLVDRLHRIGVTSEIVNAEQVTTGVVMLELNARAPEGIPGLLRVRPNRLVGPERTR